MGRHLPKYVFCNEGGFFLANVDKTSFPIRQETFCHIHWLFLWLLFVVVCCYLNPSPLLSSFLGPKQSRSFMVTPNSVACRHFSTVRDMNLNFIDTDEQIWSSNLNSKIMENNEVRNI